MFQHDEHVRSYNARMYLWIAETQPFTIKSRVSNGRTERCVVEFDSPPTKHDIELIIEFIGEARRAIVQHERHSGKFYATITFFTEH